MAIEFINAIAIHLPSQFMHVIIVCSKPEMSMFEVLPSLKFLYKCHCTLHLNLASEMDPKFTLYLNCFLLVLQKAPSEGS